MCPGLEFILNISNLVPIKIKRDKKGRFIKRIQPFIPLQVDLMNRLIGELLGDGHLRFTHRDKQGKPSGNVSFAITLKQFDHISFLKLMFTSICTPNSLRPWPNPNTGKRIQQYTFNTKSLPSLTIIHAQWYSWSNEKNRFKKFIPLNIGDLLKPVGLAHWIMGDGYWDKSEKTLIICTDSFTLSEVELLIKILKDNFDLMATVKRRTKENQELCWRIRFSSKSENIAKLVNLVQPYLIPSMHYKLNI